MRIALVADLHGNMPATEAVANDIKNRSVDAVWCLGDIVGKGPSSHKTFDWAFSHCDMILRGNWDDGVGFKRFSPNDQFYYDQLGPDRLRKLCVLPLEHHCMLSGRYVRFFHGRPTMPALISPNADEDALSWLFQPDFDTLIYADIHRAGLNLLRGGRMVCTVGSVGNSLRLPLAQYAILTCTPGSCPAPFDMQFIYLPYDRDRAIADARAAESLPGRDAYLTEVATGIYSRKKV